MKIENVFNDREALASEKKDLLTAKESSTAGPVPSKEEQPEGHDTELSSQSGRAVQQPELSPLPPVPTGESPAESEVMSSPSLEDTDHGCPIAPSLAGPSTSNESISFYDFFLHKISKTCAESAKTPEELAELFDLNKTQVNAWLKRALTEKKVRKLSKPVRYEWIDVQQTSLFET
ncbi:MAG: hypothetical protein ACFCVA_07835 [Gammaproteobacteria bacterium]